MKKTLTCHVDSKFQETLEKLREDAGFSSLDEVFQHAVSLYDWSRIQIQEGYTIGAFKNGEVAKQCILPFAVNTKGET